MAGKVGRSRADPDEGANRPAVGTGRPAPWSEPAVRSDPADQTGRSLSSGTSSPETRLPLRRPDVVPALLQLLGWVGWLGIGYMAWGRVLVGALMLIGWWTAFWVLLFFTLVTQTVALSLAVLAWVLVPLITSVALWVEASAAARHTPLRNRKSAFS